MKKKEKGAILILVLVYGTLFLIILGGLLGFVFVQYRQISQKMAWHESLDIAEAGIDYYRWCLNHGIEGNCPLQKDYYDADGNLLGKFSLDVSTSMSCGQAIKRNIISTGWTNKYPDIKRKISVLYAKTSVAKYSYILNDDVWVGPDYEIRGPYHSNGGIRMDGLNQSTVTSSKQTWICTSSFGCGPQGFPGKGWGLGQCGDPCYLNNKNCICPGVFSNTDNSKPDLFIYPSPPFDFNAITVDLAQMKNFSQNNGGIYLPPSPSGKGYHLKFFKDALTNQEKFEAWVITGLSKTYAYSYEEDWHYDYFTITGEYLYGTYNVPQHCSVIFVEDNLWLEGTISGKVSLASANISNPGVDTDVVLIGNVDYSTTDGTDGFTLIGERNILIGPQSPDYMKLRGIYIAQKGRFGRNHYPGNVRQSLEIYGSVVSNGRVGTQWTSGSQVISGYLSRETYFDSNLVYNPPIFTPFIDTDFKILQWEER